jgi:hypothetical protein
MKFSIKEKLRLVKQILGSRVRGDNLKKAKELKLFSSVTPFLSLSLLPFMKG